MGHGGDDTMIDDAGVGAGHDALPDVTAALRFCAERGIVVPARFAAAAARAVRTAACQRGVSPSDFIRLASAEATERYLPPIKGPVVPGAHA